MSIRIFACFLVSLMFISAVTACENNGDCQDGLSCIDKVCSACRGDSDCDGFDVCSTTSRCAPKRVLDVSWQDVVGSLVIFLGAMLAAGGGLGGGGIFIPVLILIVGMETKQAIALSTVTIFGGSIVNMAFNARMRHPTRPLYPLIDWTAILMFTPTLLAGTTIGVMLNVIFPSWLVTALLAVTLAYGSFRTTKKAIRAWKQESKSSRSHHISVSIGRDPDIPNPSSKEAIELNDIPDSVHSAAAAKDSKAELLNEMIEKEANPTISVVLMVLIGVYALVISIIRGGKAGGTSLVGVETCSPLFWSISVIFLFSLALITFILGRWLSMKTEKKEKLGWKHQASEILWSRRNSILYPLFATFAGLLGGMLGIGGGMILGPLLLEFGLESRSVAATSATAVFITALSAAIQFLLLGQLLADYAVWLFLIGMVSTFLGQTLINYLIRKYERASFIVGCIAAVIIVATIMLTVAGIFEVIDDIKNGRPLGFSSSC